MKKLMIVIAAFGLSASAFAMPNIGDDAVFAFTDTQNGQNYTGTVEFKLVSYDSTAKTWSEAEIIKVNGQTNNQTQTLTSDQLVTDANAQAILTNCAADGGALQSITVPAGTFNTCALPDNATNQTGTVWISTVTFGVVQSDTTNTSTGEHTVLKLASATPGT